MNQPLVSLVIPYYNEEDYLPAMLASVLAQSDRRFCLILVDNLSTDASTSRAKALLEGSGIAITWLREARKGQLFALIAGTAAAETRYVATLDADTFYPPDFVSNALRLLEGDPGVAAAMAINVGEDRAPRNGSGKWWQVRLWPDKCHAGGAGHVYRRAMFAAAGGFDDARWPFVLFDHEMAHRMRQQGRFAYAHGHVIHASDRRGGDARSWNLLERGLYKLLPGAAMDWYFYRFLGPRLAARGLRAVALRDGVWRAEVQAAS